MLFLPERIRRPAVIGGILVIGTILTQVGGVILAAAWWYFRFRYFAGFRRPRAYAALASLTVYFLATVTAIPLLALAFGRAPLPWWATRETPLAPRSLLFCLLNRHYVHVELRDTVVRSARQFGKEKPHSVIYYLDANFPFLDGFPLFPHLSHSDGRKIDFTYCYRRKKSPSRSTVSPSPIGYFIYEAPRPGEPAPYSGKFCWLRWDFPFLQWINRHRELDPEATRRFLRILLRQPETEKVLMELHLHRRLGVSSGKLRFQQCNAARHDDHIHFQISR